MAVSVNEKALVADRSIGSVASKLFKFVLVGGACTALQYVLLIALVQGLGWRAAPASMLGYLASSIVSYVLNRSFTFESAADHRRSLPRFFAISLIGLGLNGAITYVGAEVLGVHYLIAQAAATGVTLLWNFLANLRLTF